MKKLLIITALLLLIFGCKKNEEKFTLNVIVENGSQHSSKIDMVYAKTIGPLQSTPETIAEVSYGNGTFTFELPGTIEDKFLFPIENSILPGAKDIKISNKNAKIAVIALFAEKDGKHVGNILRSSFDQSMVLQWQNPEILEILKDTYATGAYGTTYIYANKPVTITGTSIVTELQGYEINNPYTYTYNLKLTKGWNKYTTKSTGTWENMFLKDVTMEVTNTEPTGMKWYLLGGLGKN